MKGIVSLLICTIVLSFLANSNAKMPDGYEAFFFKTIEKTLPLFRKLDTEADFLKVMQKLHIFTPTKVCSKCREHYKKKMGEHTLDTWFSQEFEKIADEMCHKYLPAQECDGIVQLYMPLFFEQYFKHQFEPEYACGSQGFCDNGYTVLDFEDYYKEVMKDKKTVQEKKPTFKQGTYKVVQLNDNHFEKDYEEGREGKCKLTACCHSGVEMAEPNSDTAAGYWGYSHGMCDIPKRTVEQAFDFIANLSPEYILWTGDSNGHRIWTQTPALQMGAMLEMTDLLKKKIPKEIPIYPIYGNHELFPLDEFDFMNIHKYDLLSKAADAWKDWIDEEAVESVKKRGYYSMINSKLNLKIIILFTDLANVMNFYLMPNPVDPLNQLEWLRNELYDAEKNDYQVIIQGHIPINNEQIQSTWGMRYQALVERFSHLIKGQFFAHTHTDYYALFRSYTTKEPVGVQFVSPSLTTFADNLPSIRVYEFDRETNILVNVHNYRLDLEEVNKKKEAAAPLQWYHAGDYVSDYGLKNYTSLEELVKLNVKFETDLSLLEIYDKNFHQGQAQLTVEQLKDEVEKYTILCNQNYGVFEEVFTCLKQYIAEHLDWEARKLISDFSKTWYYFKSDREDSQVETQ